MLRDQMECPGLPSSLLTSGTFLSGLERLWSLSACVSLLQQNMGSSLSFPTFTWQCSTTLDAPGTAAIETMTREVAAVCAALSIEHGVSDLLMLDISRKLRLHMSPATSSRSSPGPTTFASWGDIPSFHESRTAPE